MNNTVVRTISGICFLGIMLSGLLLNRWLFAALHVIIVAIMMIEFYTMSIGKGRYPVSTAIAVLIAIGIFATTFCVYGFNLPARLIALNMIPFLALMISILFIKDKSSLRDVAFLFMGVIYIAPSVATTNALVFDNSGNFSGLLLVGFFCIIWASDVGAYCFGHLFGKNGKKLFPSVSPKKSWAGFWGGMVLALVAGVVLQLTGLFPFSIVHSLVIAVIMDVAGVFGVLFESQWKRIFGYKDSGNIIPGHGGLLDRFDSALFAVPAGLSYMLITGLL